MRREWEEKMRCEKGAKMMTKAKFERTQRDRNKRRRKEKEKGR